MEDVEALFVYLQTSAAGLTRGAIIMEEAMYPVASKEIARKREELAPEILDTFRSFSCQVFADGLLPSKTKELIAAAVPV